MSSTPSVPPSEAGDAFERALFTLAVAGPTPGRVESFSGNFAVVRDAGDARRTVLLRVRGEVDPRITETLPALLRNLSVLPIDLVVFGGPKGQRKLWKSVVPSMSRVTLYHVADGESAAWKFPGFFGGRTSALPFRTTDAAFERALLERKITDDLRLGESERKEVAPFLERLRTHRPVVTSALIVLIAGVFVVERTYGADANIAFVHLGAMVGKLAFHGEWWRFGASMFLHGGAVHFALNAYVLWVLGRSVEAMLGSKRFLILYGVAGIAGGVLSGLVHPIQVSVGASGALWGLLGAEGVLAYAPRGILPSSMIPRARRVARNNLIINLGISFLPHIDLAAHLGGGIAGALLVFSGLLTRGLPRMTDATANAPGSNVAGSEGDRSPVALALAIVLGAVLVASPLVGIARGRIWALDDAPTWARRTMASGGVSFDAPATLPPGPEERTQEGFVQTFGNLLNDPALLVVTVAPHDAGEDVEHVKAELAESLKHPPEKATLVSGPTWQAMHDGDVLLVSYRYASGALYERGFVLRPDATWIVDSATLPSWAKYQGLPARVLDSMARAN